MKVCVLSQSLYALGGIQRVLATLFNHMVEENSVEITVLMPSLPSEKNIYGLDKSIKCVNVLNFEDNTILTKLIRGLRKINQKTFLFDLFGLSWFQKQFVLLPGVKKKYLNLIDNKYDIVIGVGCWYSIVLALLSKNIKAKKIGWMHSTYESYFYNKENRSAGYSRFFKRICGNLDEILVLTLSDKKVFDRELKIDSKVLYNPVSPIFLKGARQYSGNCNLLFVGRLVQHHKGIDLLIPIMENVLKNYPHAHITIVGEGPDQVIFETMIKNAGLEKTFSLVGKKSNVEEFYLKSDVVLVPSRYEGFGVVLLEAMGCGTPVVAFHNKGPDEIIYSGVDGYLIEQYDVRDFAEKVKELIENEQRWENMSKASFRRASDFSVNVTASQFIHFISSARGLNGR